MANTSGYGFQVSVAPLVTAGAYTAGDIVGTLMTFANVAPAVNSPFVITGVDVAIKAAITSSLKLVLFKAFPAATTLTDNSAWSLAAADVFKVVSVIDFDEAGAVLCDHGTPNTYSVNNINLVCNPAEGTRDIYGILIDGTGFTPTSIYDVQVTLRGFGT
jgi:hypothetical protein